MACHWDGRGNYMFPKGLLKNKNLKTKDLIPCSYCGEDMDKSKKHKHINVMQNPKIKCFCSEDCKLVWIFETQKEGN